MSVRIQTFTRQQQYFHTLHNPDAPTMINPALGGCDSTSDLIITNRVHISIQPYTEHIFNTDHNPVFLLLGHNDHYNHHKKPLSRYNYALIDWTKYRIIININIIIHTMPHKHN